MLGSSPAGEGSLFWRLRDKGNDGADDRVRSFKTKSTDNPRIDRAHIQASELTEAFFAAEYLGAFVGLQGAVFKWDQVRACFDGGHAEAEAAPGARRLGIARDPARARDPSGAVIEVAKKPWRVVDIADVRGVDYVEQVRRVADFARHYKRSKVTVDVI